MGTNFTDDFFKEVYIAELENKHKLDSADSLLVGILLALSGVGIYYSKLLPSCSFGVPGYAFLACTLIFLIAFGISTGFVIASFWPRVKEYIASPKEWGEFVEGLREYYTHYHKEDEAERRVADDLAKSLRKKYIDAGEVNRNHNIKKQAYQSRARYSITAAVVLILLNTIPTYFVQCVTKETQKTEIIAFPEIQKVEIITSKSKDKSNERTKQTDPANATDPTNTTDPANTTDPSTKTRTSQEYPIKGWANKIVGAKRQ